MIDQIINAIGMPALTNWLLFGIILYLIWCYNRLKKKPSIKKYKYELTSFPNNQVGFEVYSRRMSIHGWRLIGVTNDGSKASLYWEKEISA